MTMLKKLSVAALFAAMVSVAVAATATIYFAVSVPSPGQWKFGSGLGQVTHVRINNAVPTTGTVTLAWVSNDKTVTNAAFLTATCTNGAHQGSHRGYRPEFQKVSPIQFHACQRSRRSRAVKSELCRWLDVR